jgi:small subunit ribosomal protein S6
LPLLAARDGSEGGFGGLSKTGQIHKEDRDVSDRVYDVLFIADPNLGEPEADALTDQVQGFIEKEGGKIQKIEKWGKKRLAYPVGKHREGYYVLIVAEGAASMVKEVERRVRVTDGIFRYLTVRVDEELRKAERRKARRAALEEKKRSRAAARATVFGETEVQR